jgi:hypothetical protein
MTQEKKSAIYFGVWMAVCMGCFYAFQFDWRAAIFSGVFSGVLSGFLTYLFITSKRLNRQMQIEVQDDGVILSGPANHFLNWEGAGGKLYLLKDKLWFKSHRFNLQNHEWQMPIDQIKEVKLYNVLGIVPNGLEIITDAGKNEKFVTNNREEWKAAIISAKGGNV